MDHTKLVIVKAGCRDVGRELLNSLSIYAYGLELGIPVKDHPVAGRGSLIKWSNALYARYMQKKHGGCALNAWREIMYLPPTKPLPPKDCSVLYFFGWLFRNPAGLIKHRAKLLEHFGPSKSEQKFIKKALAGAKGKTLIGVHLHQTPYAGFPDGEFLLPAERARKAADEYLRMHTLTANDVVLAVVSDTKVPAQAFEGLAVIESVGDTKANLHLLSKCSVVLGDNSIYSNVAAWFGNIPHIVTTQEPIDWEYYAHKNDYFENKYATFAL